MKAKTKLTKRAATKKGATTKKAVAKKVGTKKAATTRRAGAKKAGAKKAVASRAPAKRVSVTAKVSPLKGMPVTDWVKAKTSGWQTEAIVVLLEVAAKAAPKATVSIKWGQPVIEHRGPIAWVKAAKAHVAIGFWRGRELTGGERLEGSGERMAHLKVSSPAAIDAKWIGALVQEAASLNERLGDPSKPAR